MLLFPIIINPNQVTYQFYLYTKLKAYLTAHIIKACLLVTWPINLEFKARLASETATDLNIIFFKTRPAFALLKQPFPWRGWTCSNYSFADHHIPEHWSIWKRRILIARSQ